jgi:hypothetical protein
MPAKYNVVRIVAAVFLFTSLATQTLLIAHYWWEFDPRLSCDRLPYWGEWIDCLHGKSHLYLVLTEMALGSWLIAGVAMLLGRFIPIFISVIVPGGVAILVVWYMVVYWYEEVIPRAPFGEPTARDVFVFALTAGVFAAHWIGPVIGAWLFGLCARADDRLLRVWAGP